MNESPFDNYVAKLHHKIHKKKVLIKNLQGDLKKFQNTLALEQEAELLTSNFHVLKRGMKEVKLTDYSKNPIEEKTIKLDVRLSPKLLIEKMFNSIKKAKRGQKIVLEKIDEERQELAFLEQTLAEALALGDKDFVVPVEKKPVIHKKEVIKPGRKPYRVYLSSDNLRILVGRSAKDSDELTLRHTRGNEWWFHARDVPGAHVVVKYSEALPEQTLQEAAMLAAYFSKIKNGTTVQYTQVKFVKKPKNVAAGLVSISKEKTIDIIIDEKLLAKLLKSGGA
jgi:predicted ribosome quality control (RQC) complex YloA/Tae2 family protein